LSSPINNDSDPVVHDFGPLPNNEHQDPADFPADDSVSAHDPWLHSDKLQSHSLHLKEEGDGNAGVHHVFRGTNC